MKGKRYEIRVTEYTHEIRIAGKEWEKGAGDGSEGEENYGYTPEIKKNVSVNREIYRQNTDKLNLKKVIEAINHED